MSGARRRIEDWGEGMIRKAFMSDVDAVEAIYERILDEEEAGPVMVGWLRGVYPVRQTAADAVERGDLFVMEEQGAVVASGIINQRQVAEYAACPWTYDAPEQAVMVLHTLAVDPRAAGRGHGTAFVRFYERYAADHGCPYLRMDTNAKNKRARRMYERLGFWEAGIVPCVFNGIPDVDLVCLEKKLM